MGTSTKIEWTEATWNPVTGCTPISAGCQNCYARRMATRLRGRCGYPAVEPFRVTLRPERLKEPLHWRKPRRVFVVSMGDLFHEDVPDTYIEAVMGFISLAGQHTFQVLTKRPERMASWFAKTDLSQCQAELAANPAMYGDVGIDFKVRDSRAINGTCRGLGDGNYWPLPNLWLGVSVENQAAADVRIPLLLKCPASVRFLSCEPLLGPMNLRSTRLHEQLGPAYRDQLGYYPDLHWVIAGGESGPHARPAHPDWFRSLRDQCSAAGVPFFFKQWGEWAPY